MQEKRCFFLILGHFGPIKHNKRSAERSVYLSFINSLTLSFVKSLPHQNTSVRRTGAPGLYGTSVIVPGEAGIINELSELSSSTIIFGCMYVRFSIIIISIYTFAT